MNHQQANNRTTGRYQVCSVFYITLVSWGITEACLTSSADKSIMIIVSCSSLTGQLHLLRKTMERSRTAAKGTVW